MIYNSLGNDLQHSFKIKFDYILIFWQLFWQFLIITNTHTLLLL